MFLLKNEKDRVFYNYGLNSVNTSMPCAGLYAEV